jgi:16S rRNA (guanine966-N2)-methyltransferase
VRVIAGTFKGRRLKTPTWTGLRPTSDKLRETLFNILTSRVTGARVLDGYAGTGALGIEALSRGAKSVTFIEADRRAQDLIATNLAICGVESGYAIIRATAVRAFERLLEQVPLEPFDIVLLDPPYASENRAGIDAILPAAGCVLAQTG